jgi:hypothetical protein
MFNGFRFIFRLKYPFWTIVFYSYRLIFWNYINFIYSNISLRFNRVFLLLYILFRDFNRLFSFLRIFIAFNFFNNFYFVLQDFGDFNLIPIIFNSYWVVFNLLNFRSTFLLNLWLLFSIIINLLNRFFIFSYRSLFYFYSNIFCRFINITFLKSNLLWLFFIFKTTVFNPDFIRALVLSFYCFFLFSFDWLLFFFNYLFLFDLLLLNIFLNFNFFFNMVFFNLFPDFFWLYFISFFMFLRLWIYYLLFIFFFNSYSCINFLWFSLFYNCRFFRHNFWFNWNLLLFSYLFFLMLFFQFTLKLILLIIFNWNGFIVALKLFRCEDFIGLFFSFNRFFFGMFWFGFRLINIRIFDIFFYRYTFLFNLFNNF